MYSLAIEDDPDLVRMLERALGAHGHRVLSAGSGEAGVRLAAAELVDAVLLGITRPGDLDGHRTLARIRAERPDLPVLMLAARDDTRHKGDAFPPPAAPATA